MTAFKARCAAALLIVGMTSPAPAQEPPYHSRLLRLAEILGSIHYLRQLCGEDTAVWRDQMNALIASENPPADRKAQLIASFNHGYRSYVGVYLKCNATAGEAIARFMAEGAQLSGDIATRYGS